MSWGNWFFTVIVKPELKCSRSDFSHTFTHHIWMLEYFVLLLHSCNKLCVCEYPEFECSLDGSIFQAPLCKPTCLTALWLLDLKVKKSQRCKCRRIWVLLLELFLGSAQCCPLLAGIQNAPEYPSGIQTPGIHMSMEDLNAEWPLLCVSFAEVQLSQLLKMMWWR